MLGHGFLPCTTDRSSDTLPTSTREELLGKYSSAGAGRGRLTSVSYDCLPGELSTASRWSNSLTDDRLERTKDKSEHEKLGILELLASFGLGIKDIAILTSVILGFIGTMIAAAYQVGEYKEVLDNNIVQKNKEISELQSQLTASRTRGDEGSTKLTEMEDAASSASLDSKHQLSQKDSVIGSLNSKIANLETEASQKNDEITNLRAQLADMQDTTSSTSFDYKRQLRQKDSVIASLNSQIASLETEVAEKSKDQSTPSPSDPTRPNGYIMNPDEIGVNYWSINHRIFYPGTLTLCRESCRTDLRCLAFTFTGTADDGTCYLKPIITGRTTGGTNTLISATKVRQR